MRVFFIILAAMAFADLATADMKMVCYYTNWAQYRPAGVKFFPEDIDVTLCTHVMFAFAKISSGGLEHLEWNDISADWAQGMYKRTMNLKQKNAALKVSISVGGWNQASHGFSDAVASEANMEKFANHSIGWMRKLGFDGLDMDWEYPGVGSRGSRPEHKHAFTVLIRKLRAAFETEAAATGKERLLLTAAVGVGKSTIEAAYEVSELAKELDFVDLMTYDLHGAWEKRTGAHIALYPRADETGNERLTNVDWAVNEFTKLGLPANKLVMGLASYGRGFTLADKSKTGMGDPVKGASAKDRYTKDFGIMSYYEICQHIKEGWTAKYHPEHQVMYANGGDQWVAYDDDKTIGIKAQYIKDKGLGGGMLWALDLDDFKGTFCGGSKYPLLNALAAILFKGGNAIKPTTSVLGKISTPSGPDPDPTQGPNPSSSRGINPSSSRGPNPSSSRGPNPTGRPVPDLTQLPKPEPSKCTAAGQHIGVTDTCRDFIVCTSVHGGVRRTCPASLHFSTTIGVCDWPTNVHRDDCKVITDFIY